MRTVDLQSGAVQLIDQTALPDVFQLVECRSLDEIADAIRTMKVRGAPAMLLTVARDLCDEDVAANHQMGAHGAALIPEQANVLTHCNTGSLATVEYGTALGVIRSAIGAGKRVHIYVDETRPFLQGTRLTAWELQEDG